MSFTRTLLITLAMAGFAHPSPAAVLVSDFSSFSPQLLPPMAITWNNGTSDQYTQGSGFISITSVGGGDPKGDGYFEATFPGGSTADFSALSALSLTAQVDAGNASSTLSVLFYDSTTTEVASATFLASSFSSSFSTDQIPLIPTGSGDLTKVSYWRISGDAIPSDSFRFSFDNLVAVPEPAACLQIALGLIFLFGAMGKRPHRSLARAA